MKITASKSFHRASRKGSGGSNAQNAKTNNTGKRSGGRSKRTVEKTYDDNDIAMYREKTDRKVKTAEIRGKTARTGAIAFAGADSANSASQAAASLAKGGVNTDPNPKPEDGTNPKPKPWNGDYMN